MRCAAWGCKGEGKGSEWGGRGDGEGEVEREEPKGRGRGAKKKELRKKLGCLRIGDEPDGLGLRIRKVVR